MPHQISRSILPTALALVLPLLLGEFRAEAGQAIELRTAASAQSAVSNSDDGVDRPSTKPRHLVIFLHGFSGSGSRMAALERSWKSELIDTEFVAPDAPLRHRSGGREWFVVDDQVLRPDRIEGARRAFDGLIRDIVKQEGFENDLDKVAFVGVSQGAIMGLDAVASGRWKVGAVVSFAGLLPLPPAAQSGAPTPILLMHGGADRTIPASASTSAANQMKSAGFNVTLDILPGVGHTITAEEAGTALRFLAQNFTQ
jgi:phospholipase/carboxylesterase